MAEPLLAIDGLEAWYGASRALHGVAFEVPAGQVTSLLGRNGAGKTTTMRAIMGMVRRRGSIRLRGRETVGLPPHRVAREGVAYCPEERGIYASLTVEENLTLAPVTRPGGLGLSEIWRMFPNLVERRTGQGTKLSGGEQQMLAIARCLRTGADLLLLDEPTEGLAPVIVQQIGRLLRDLRGRGLTVLLVEQNLRFAKAIADRHLVLESGRIVDAFDPASLAANESRLQGYLQV